MEKEKHLMSDEDMEKVGGGHTVKGGREICDQFEPMQPDYYIYPNIIVRTVYITLRHLIS